MTRVCAALQRLTIAIACVCIGGSSEEGGGTHADTPRSVSPQNSDVWGPGLNNNVFLPVRYFYIQAVDQFSRKYNESVGEKAFSVRVYHKSGDRVRAWTQVLDRQDGGYIVRYRLWESVDGLEIDVMHQGQHVAQSPYSLSGPLYHEYCNCPQPDIGQWFQDMECPASYSQIKKDLSIFKDLDFQDVAKEAVKRFNRAGQHSICHYQIIDNKIYRQTYGEHVGFKMFSDALLLSVLRKVQLPDMEFIVNFGDWPLEKKSIKDKPIPIFSWCGSRDSRDIVMPTYDITEATLEMMSRVSLDLFSVQANTGPRWADKLGVALWRGRDSRQERLELVELARKHPDKINASLTNMFFFPKDEEKYGKLVKPMSFFDFFKYKYQLNIDGTVAAYRMPYLLAGDAVVMKQDSPFYEHFYHQLEPYVHYIPLQRNLSDVLEKISWAKEHDEEARTIGRNAQEFARTQLTPAEIYCYHVKLFTEFAKLLTNKPTKNETFEHVEQEQKNHNIACNCQPYPEMLSDDKENHDEL